ncbi:hypothetical protein I4U23_019952 [Adineta vaga]|nr:hypothetical protein I4U23_019952 [Adineta vaga]
MLKKVVSGGQTGVDRSALDVAIEMNFPYGGWCPRGRIAEDGTIDPVKYANLAETSTNRYPQRTEMNVRDSDGTLIIFRGNENTMSAGTKLTTRMAEKHHKPLFIVNLDEKNESSKENQVCEWIIANKIEILNVAGPREETTPGIYKHAEGFFRKVLQILLK